MHLKKTAILVLFVLSYGAGSISAIEFKIGKVKAYPNPFSPRSEKLTIVPENSSAFDGDVTYCVYNYNQKMLYKGSASNSPIYWSGHTTDGKIIVPGLYFIKIVQTRSDYSTGSTIIKLIVK